jgi:hypothetical protein
MSYDNQRAANRLILYNLKEQDQGDYECQTVTGVILRFRIYMGDQPETETPETNTEPDSGVDVRVLSADIDSKIELVCGQSTQYDGYIEWRRLDDGVKFILSILNKLD